GSSTRFGLSTAPNPTRPISNVLSLLFWEFLRGVPSVCLGSPPAGISGVAPAMAWTRSASHVFGRPPATGSRLQLWHALTKALSPAYRPELHYMRGPGPKWHEKHDQGATRRVMIPPRNASANSGTR